MAKDYRYYKLLNTAKWRKLRRKQLVKQPLCEECLKRGTIKAADQVHHKRPIERALSFEEMEILAYDSNNLESVCQECHKNIHNHMGSHNDTKAAMKRIQKAEIDEYLKNFT